MENLAEWETGLFILAPMAPTCSNLIFMHTFFGGSRLSGDKMHRISAVSLNDVCVQEVVSRQELRP